MTAHIGSAYALRRRGKTSFLTLTKHQNGAKHQITLLLIHQTPTISVCKFTLFLKKSGSEQLTAIAIMLAFTGRFVTVILGNVIGGFLVNG